MAFIRYGTITLGGSELRTGTSRFLAQGAFAVYKLVMAAYFMFWGVYWPRAEGFRKQSTQQLPFWTWSVCTGYFIISTVAALVCWRALKKNDGPAPTWPPPASRQEKNVQPHLEGQAADNDPTSQAPSSTPTLSTPTEKASARKGAGSRARKRGGTSPLPLGLRWLLLLSWNIACTGSLLVTIAWFTEDYVRQVQQDVTNFDIQTHGLVAFLMLVDQLLIADEFKLRHIVISQVYGVIYVVFSIFWFYVAPEEDKYLYKNILDWDTNRVQACMWIGASLIVMVPMAALVHFSLYRLREALHGRLQEKRAQELKRQASSIVRAPGSFRC